MRERLAAWGRRLWSLLGTGFELFPLTPLGLLVVFASSTALLYVAMPEMDLVLIALGWVVLAIALVSMLAVTAGAIRLYFATAGYRGPGERTLETLRSLPTGFSTPGLLFLPFVQVFWEWLDPDAQLEIDRHGFRLSEDAKLFARGYVSGVRRRLVVRDVFGLAKVAFRHHDPGQLTVLPNAGMLREMPILISMSGGDDFPHPMGIEDGDRVELRRYAPGDPARFIHWKVFGRTRKLVVRKPERALTRARRVVSYLVAGPSDEASAAAARVAVEHGALGTEWVFGADGSIGESRDVAGGIDRIVRSADAAKGTLGASALHGFLTSAEESGPAALVLFVPAEPGPWLERALAVVKPRARRTKVVIGVDGIAPRVERPLVLRALLRDAPPPRVSMADALEAVVRAFSGLGVEVVVVDRTNGRRLGEQHRRAMAQLAEAKVGEAARPKRAKRARPDEEHAA